MIDEQQDHQPKLLRIHHYLAQCGVLSRRRSEELIREGKVLINSQRAIIGQKVEEGDDVRVEGKRVTKEKKVYIAFNKPKGVLSTSVRERGIPCALEYIPRKERLFIAGRLDLDAEGLLLITNDGEWAQRVAHPKHETSKMYIVDVDRPLETIPRRLNIDYRRTVITSRKRTPTTWEITLHEGRKHIVKNIFKKLRRTVQRLERIRIGAVALGGLKKGAWRELTPQEIESFNE